jgi:hypothetical protein
MGGSLMSSFFPVSKGDLAYLLAVLAFALIAFLPFSREHELAGVALLGWLMAVLMIIAPALALVRILTERRSASRQRPAAADTEDDRDPRHGEEDGAS